MFMWKIIQDCVKIAIFNKTSQEYMNFIFHISSTTLAYSNVYLKNQIIVVL